jgi:hypothetical protein
VVSPLFTTYPFTATGMPISDATVRLTLSVWWSSTRVYLKVSGENLGSNAPSETESRLRLAPERDSSSTYTVMTYVRVVSRFEEVTVTNTRFSPTRSGSGRLNFEEVTCAESFETHTQTNVSSDGCNTTALRTR